MVAISIAACQPTRPGLWQGGDDGAVPRSPDPNDPVGTRRLRPAEEMRCRWIRQG